MKYLAKKAWILVIILTSTQIYAQTEHKAVVGQGNTTVASSDPWKGAPYNHPFDLHGGLGLGIFEGNAGLSFLFGIGVEIAHEGFIGDGINDQAYLELTTGPVILSNTVDPWVYSLHLRWDFHLDVDWTYYALGGFSGSFGTGVGRFFPRFGAGIVKHLTQELGVRGEVSHEWIMVAVTFSL